MMNESNLESLLLLSETKIILRALYESTVGVSVYALYQEYQLSPAQLSRVLRSLEQEAYVTEADRFHFCLTETGRIWLIQNRKKIFWNANQYWKSVPEAFKRSGNQRHLEYRKYHLHMRDIESIRRNKKGD